MTTVRQPTDTAHEEFARKRRQAATASYQGLFLDYFDIYAPIIALAPAMVFFTGTDMSQGEKTLIYYLTFASTLIGRPLGSLIFGSLADRIGRRRVSLVTVAGFTLCTGLIGILPGYDSIGLAAPILLVLLRMLDGVFLGGEYAAAAPMAYEYVEREKRGSFGGLLQTSFPFAYVTVSAITLVILQVLPDGGLNSPYVQWGWRITFLLSAVLSAVFWLFRLKNLPESDLWKKSARVKSPLKAVMFGEHRRVFWQVFMVMSGLWFITASTSSVIPNLLGSLYGMSDNWITWTMLIAHVLLVAVFFGAGWGSQKVGRKPMLVFLGLLVGTAGTALWCLFAAKLTDNPLLIALMAIAIPAVVFGVNGVSVTYCNERFSTGVRSAGFAGAFSLAIVIPNCFAFYSVWIGHVIPIEYATAVCYVLGGGLIAVGALLGPETRSIDFDAELTVGGAGAAIKEEHSV
ncbi:MFS transporter [Streptomyces sp. NPDC060209]|uniref:MFS transporter n=1 Tax=Streptomyces sp. NPDC060209 TaxID=3347073 RepID=UPI0036627BF3